MTLNEKIGFAFCGSFCTLENTLKELENLVNLGYEIIPIMSPAVYNTDTRFGTAAYFIEKVEKLTNKKIIHEIKDAEPIGPKKLLDLLLIAPCTGNTLGKLANGITDTSVTMAAKSHLRNERPLVIAPSTNDALGASAKNIGQLMNCKNIYFVPFGQDLPEKKHNSCVADYTKIPQTIESALKGEQLQPMLF